jgi:hypothetical protein
MSQALTFSEALKRVRLAHSSRKGPTRVIGAGAPLAADDRGKTSLARSNLSRTFR